MQIKFKKLNPDIKLPEYKTEKASGMDFYCPKETVVYAGETAKIPSGLAIELPEGYELILRGRSGLSTMNTYLFKTGTIDNDYRGELAFVIHNPNTEGNRLILSKGERIAQGTLRKFIQADIVEVEELTVTKRNTGGFGHTGKN